MKFILEPDYTEFESLAKRPELELSQLENSVRDIFNEVKSSGDLALKNYALKFDQAEISNLQVTTEELEEAEQFISNELKAAIETAYANIYKFHAAQQKAIEKIETMPGVSCWRKSVGIEKVAITNQSPSIKCNSHYFI